LVDGQTHVDKVEEVLGVEIPEGEYVTLAGFLMDQTGEVPVEGQIVTYGAWEFRVQSVEKRRVHDVVVQRLANSDDDADAPVGADERN
jgi:CBS domain containing-hemolysin-like protein